MKIVSTLPAPVPPPSKSDAKAVDRLDRVSPAGDGVSLSPDARWVTAVKEEAKNTQEIRADLVEKTREAIAAGTYESTVDLEALVSSVLADL